MDRMHLGNGLWESYHVKTRFQTAEIGLVTSANSTNRLRSNYSYGSTNNNEYGEMDANVSLVTNKNNGNIARQTLNFSGLAAPFVQSFRYDSLNRLLDAQETNNGQQTWQQTFGFDRYGTAPALVRSSAPNRGFSEALEDLNLEFSSPKRAFAYLTD